MLPTLVEVASQIHEGCEGRGRGDVGRSRCHTRDDGLDSLLYVVECRVLRSSAETVTASDCCNRVQRVTTSTQFGLALFRFQECGPDVSLVMPAEVTVKWRSGRTMIQSSDPVRGAQRHQEPAPSSESSARRGHASTAGGDGLAGRQRNVGRVRGRRRWLCVRCWCCGRRYSGTER